MNIFKSKYFSSQSKVAEKAVSGKRMRPEKDRLSRACAKLDPAFEQMMAEEGIAAELGERPEY